MDLKLVDFGTMNDGYEILHSDAKDDASCCTMMEAHYLLHGNYCANVLLHGRSDDIIINCIRHLRINYNYEWLRLACAAQSLEHAHSNFAIAIAIADSYTKEMENGVMIGH